eukprot:TRINITY_DN16144_c0_g1_i3.p1 TRINITY_DN16144_c0_g1~~TRINITY_DN16144_c0_g1_i3.p1  ORF type:complete len:441 (-),score=70.91 TRINITY_DN16144_c0_g1_i3:109-1431(-)
MLFPIYIEETLGIANNILDMLKKAVRDKSDILKIGSYRFQFTLLDNFAQQRNPYAAIVYKKLTFSLMENHADINLREFILRNFIFIFKKFQSIPCEIILQPLIKQIQVSEQSQSYQLNLCDMEFFNMVAQHPKLKLKECILLFDLLNRLYLNDLIWAGAVTNALHQLLYRFVEIEGFQEYTIKLVKISLAIFYTSCKNRKIKGPKDQAKKDVSENEIHSAQKRSLIIELMKFIINLQCRNLNDQIKPLLNNVSLQLKEIKQENKGIIMLTNLIGGQANVMDQVINQQAQKQIQPSKDPEQLDLDSESPNQFKIENDKGNDQQLHNGDSSKISNNQNAGKIVPQHEQKPSQDSLFASQQGEGEDGYNLYFLDKYDLNKDKTPVPKIATTKKPAAVDAKVIERLEAIKQKRDELIQKKQQEKQQGEFKNCLLYTSPSPRDQA